MGWGWGVKFSGKKRYEGVRFNVISITRGWVGVQFLGKKRYVTLEWPLTAKHCTLARVIPRKTSPVQGVVGARHRAGVDVELILVFERLKLVRVTRYQDVNVKLPL